LWDRCLDQPGNSIPNRDDSLESRLRIQAAVHGRSAEEEARDIIRGASTRKSDEPNRLGSAIHESFKPLGDLQLPESIKQPIRELLISGNDPSRHECRVRGDEAVSDAAVVARSMRTLGKEDGRLSDFLSASPKYLPFSGPTSYMCNAVARRIRR
jgi:plasmid stability protein